MIFWNYKKKPTNSLALRVVILAGDVGIFLIHILLCFFIPQAITEEKTAYIIGFCVIGIILFVFVLNIVLMGSSIIYKVYLTGLKAREEEKKRIMLPLYVRRGSHKKTKIRRKRRILMIVTPFSD